MPNAGSINWDFVSQEKYVLISVNQRPNRILRKHIPCSGTPGASQSIKKSEEKKC